MYKRQRVGNEFGATTGRSRRCGWLDIPALKYAIKINGVTQLMMMKADVLSMLEKIRICTHYIHNDIKLDYIPYDISGGDFTCIYKDIPSWQKDLTQLSSYEDSPFELKEYVNLLEQILELPIKIVSVGPDRKQTLFR